MFGSALGWPVRRGIGGGLDIARFHCPALILGPFHRVLPRGESATAIHQFASYEELRLPAVWFTVKAQVARHGGSIGHAKEREQKLGRARHPWAITTALCGGGLVSHRARLSCGSMDNGDDRASGKDS